MGALRSRRWLLLLAVAVLVGGAVFAWRVYSARAAAHARALRPGPSPVGSSASGATILRVPHAPGSITLDGDTDDPGWLVAPGPARTGAFLFPNGAPARPYSDARLVWGDGYLYLSLYAADEDIESRTDTPDGPLWLDDAFRLEFSQPDVTYAIEASPKAIVTDSIRRAGGKWDYTWNAGVHVSRELDGTVNDPRNMDEEWVLEMAIPFESLGMKGEPGERIGFGARRCDTPKGATRVCGSWGMGDSPAILELAP